MVSATKKWLFVVMGTAALAAVLLVMYVVYSNRPAVMPVSENSLINGNQQIGLPKRLIIHSINVDAPIIYVGLTAAGAVDTPKGPAETAWYQLGPRPGEKGSAVITGHFGPWQTGATSVFDRLHELKPGDTIYVKDDKGVELAFMVKSSKIYQPNESPAEVFNKTDGTFLNLITCNGDWLKDQKTYNQRLVVFTELVD